MDQKGSCLLLILYSRLLKPSAGYVPVHGVVSLAANSAHTVMPLFQTTPATGNLDGDMHSPVASIGLFISISAHPVKVVMGSYL